MQFVIVFIVLLLDNMVMENLEPMDEHHEVNPPYRPIWSQKMIDELVRIESLTLDVELIDLYLGKSVDEIAENSRQIMEDNGWRID